MPVVICCAALGLARLLPLAPVRDRHAASIATCLAFLTAYVSLTLGPISPATHWHFLPYALVAATVLGPVACAQGVTMIERIVVYCVVACVIAWVLVPSWDDLVPSRHVYMLGMVIYIVVLASGLHRLTQRQHGPQLPLMFWLTLSVAAVILILSGSVRFAQIALALAAASFGHALFAMIDRDNHSRGLELFFAVAVVSLMCIGHVNSFTQIPMFVFWLVPAAPLATLLGAVYPCSRCTGIAKYAVQWLPVIGTLAVAVCWGVLVSE